MVLFPEIALDVLDAAFEAHHHVFDVVDCLEEVFAEAGEHVGDDGEGDDVAVDEVVGFLPVGAAHGR